MLCSITHVNASLAFYNGLMATPNNGHSGPIFDDLQGTEYSNFTEFYTNVQAFFDSAL